MMNEECGEVERGARVNILGGMESTTRRKKSGHEYQYKRLRIK